MNRFAKIGIVLALVVVVGVVLLLKRSGPPASSSKTGVNLPAPSASQPAAPLPGLWTSGRSRAFRAR